MRQSEVKRWLWCTGNTYLERVKCMATDYYLWDLVPESYGRREVGSAVNVRSAEWEYVSELMVALIKKEFFVVVRLHVVGGTKSMLICDSLISIRMDF